MRHSDIKHAPRYMNHALDYADQVINELDSPGSPPPPPRAGMQQPGESRMWIGSCLRDSEGGPAHKGKTNLAFMLENSIIAVAKDQMTPVPRNVQLQRMRG